MSEPQTSDSELTRLDEAITATIREAMPLLEYVESHPVLDVDRMAFPALIYAITNVEPGEDPGDGRSCVLLTVEGCILVEHDRPKAPLQAAILASKLVSLVHYQQWGLEFVLPVQDVRAMPTETIPELVSCAAWSVLWRQVVYLGSTEWVWPDEPPGALVFAFDPESGTDHEGQYQPPEDFA